MLQQITIVDREGVTHIYTEEMGDRLQLKLVHATAVVRNHGHLVATFVDFTSTHLQTFCEGF